VIVDAAASGELDSVGVVDCRDIRQSEDIEQIFRAEAASDQ
jgi:hypothetical protein